MKQSQLRRFEPLYINARYMGADTILRRYLGLAEDYVLPLALAHGVDFGHIRPCQDVDTIEPIHWAHSERLYRLATTVKAAVRIPHALLLATRGRELGKGKGRLVIGPPPGPVNDQRLLDLLGSDGSSTTILVKPKQHYEHSIAFWERHGFKATTLAAQGPPTYDAMADLFGGYSEVVGCTFSSAVIFAAALGLKVELLRDFYCRAYEMTDVEQSFVFQSGGFATDVVRTFANGSAPEATSLARELLGADLDFSPDHIRDSLAETIAALKEPVYFRAPHSAPVRFLLREAALVLGKPGLTRYSIPELFRRRRQLEVLEHEMNEIAAWLEGIDERTLRLKRVKYVPGRTIPGDAVESYGDAGLATEA